MICRTLSRRVHGQCISDRNCVTESKMCTAKESRGHLSVRSSTRCILEANCSVAQVDLLSADSLVCVWVLFLHSDFMSVDFDPSPPLTVFRSTISSYHITVKKTLLNLMSCCLHLSTLSLWSPLLVSLSTHLEKIVYYETIKRELNKGLIYECQCDESWIWRIYMSHIHLGLYCNKWKW